KPGGTMAKISVFCPNPEGRAQLLVDDSRLGGTGRCSICKTTFVVALPSAAAGAVEVAVGPVLLHDYQVARPLGQGGMGTVYLARSRSDGKRFAVKTILETRLGDETSRRRFLGELRIWIDLPAHPHLAACRFFRTVGGQIAIFAEYVEGGSL